MNAIAGIHYYEKKRSTKAKIERMVSIRNTVNELPRKRSKKLVPYKETILEWLSDQPDLSAA